jgi:hypothetical protein
MLMSHTPGPWVAVDYEGHKHDNAWAGSIASESGDVVYDGPFSFWALKGNGHQQAKANARLIAAAPQMFDILAGIAAVVADDSHWGKRIAEVMKKIEGEA